MDSIRITNPAPQEIATENQTEQKAKLANSQTSNEITVESVTRQEISSQNRQTLSMAVSNSYIISGEGESYHGPFEFTPGPEEQIVPVQYKYSAENIVIKAIPSNYGLITYNGFEILVS